VLLPWAWGGLFNFSDLVDCARSSCDQPTEEHWLGKTWGPPASLQPSCVGGGGCPLAESSVSMCWCSRGWLEGVDGWSLARPAALRFHPAAVRVRVVFPKWQHRWGEEGGPGEVRKGHCVWCAPGDFTPASLLAFVLVDLNKLIYCLPGGSNLVLLLSFSLGFSCLVSVVQAAGVTGVGRNRMPGTAGTVQQSEYPRVCVPAKGWDSPREAQSDL